MKRVFLRRTAITLLTLLLAAASPSSRIYSQRPYAPQNPFIDRGACPFEGCAYRDWTANRTIQLFDRPGGRRVRTIPAGTHVTGLTGEVRSIPLRVTATSDKPDPENPQRVMIHSGQPFYVLHHLGEGAWLVWYRGKLTSVDNFSESGPYPQATWWVQIKLPDGSTWWAISDGNFDNQDSLG